MSDLPIARLEGGTTKLSDEVLTTLSGSIRGDLIAPGSPGYDESRTVWNAMIDRKPGLVIRATGAADVRTAVQFAAEHGLRLAVRGAGHNIAGSAVCDDGLLLDLSDMRAVHVDAEAKTVWVQPGATLGDVDHETQAFGLAVPTGINSTTGIAGLTLGGGFGWLSRRYGLTVDNLRSADVVTADGELLHASEKSNSDLFWALRGGGGNFGVVTSFEFDLVPVGPMITSGLIVHPLADAKPLLEFYREQVKKMSDDLTVWVVLRKAPPLPFLPEEWHGKEVAILAACYAGDMAQGEQELKELRGFGKPIADVIGPHPFAGWQAAFDPLLTPGARNYWKSHNFTEMSDALIEVILDSAGNLPSDQSEIFFASLGGAINRVAADATAYPHRDTVYLMNVHTRWEKPSQDDKCVSWARAFFEETGKHASGSVYVNFIPEDEDRVANAYGDNIGRLKQVKKKYDPKNLFRINQNISA